MDENVFMFGNSIGELTSMLSAGVFDLEIGLRILKKRSELMIKAFEGVESKKIF